VNAFDVAIRVTNTCREAIPPPYSAPLTFHSACLRLRNSTRLLDLNRTEYSSLQIIHKSNRAFGEPRSDEGRCSEHRKVIFDTLLNTIYERNRLATTNLKRGNLWIIWLLCDKLGILTRLLLQNSYPRFPCFFLGLVS
jgi:hypothetical protein